MLLHSYSLTNSGLMFGKSGIALCLFEAARFFEYEKLEEYGLELLQEAIAWETSDYSFQNGKAGIICVAEYLIKNEFIDADLQELFLCGLANELKSAIGGNTILHLHILPWKFTFERNEQLFNRLYSDFLIEKYDSISKNTIEKIAYKLSDKIICVSHSAKQYITSVFKIEPEKIVVIFNGLMNFNTGILHSYEKESGYYSLWNMG